MSDRSRLAIACAVALAAASACYTSAPPIGSSSITASSDGGEKPVAGPAYAFVNGNWFTGVKFDARKFYSVNGMIEATRPPRVDSTIDLHGGFVIPPFGDAHTHNLDGPYNLDAMVNSYINEGTFYVQVLTNARSRADQVRSRFNHPCALDVAYANGGLTSTLSHPFQAYEPRAAGFYDPSVWRQHWAEIRKSRKLENDAYWFIDSVPDLTAKWPGILAGRPDLIKIFLLNASETAQPAPPDSIDFSGHGLKPSLVPLIVRHAHDAGLRVAAHIETAADFVVAVRAGVDLLAHLPGYEMGQNESVTEREISEEVATLAGGRGIVVTPTVSLASIVFNDPDSAALVQRRQTLQRRNIALLLRHSVRFAVGSDWFGRTARGEFDALRALGLWDNLGLVKMWSETTPRSIFPTRRIGRLEPGYEASFLVLDRDPIKDLEGLRHIRLRVKQGCMM
jgi:imidazolonepropionase-like amidohydrolase